MSSEIEVSNPFVNIYTCQVCAPSNATDEDILEAANRLNPAGTTNGWSTVVRAGEEVSEWARGDTPAEKLAPVQCQDHGHKSHFLVLC